MTKNDIFVIHDSTRYYVEVRDPKGRAMLHLTKIREPNWAGNPRGTLMKQADQNRTGPYWAEMWAISGENVGMILDPYREPT